MVAECLNQMHEVKSLSKRNSGGCVISCERCNNVHRIHSMVQNSYQEKHISPITDNSDKTGLYIGSRLK